MDEKDKNELYSHLSTIHSLIGATISVTHRKKYIEIMFNKKMPDKTKSNACRLEMELGVAYNLIQEIEKSIDRLEQEANIK